MPPRDWKLRIGDILDAISKIERYVGSMSFDEFKADSKTVDAVIRNFGIIGEAANHVPEEVLAAHDEIPWRLMRGMRNVVVHVYFGVDMPIVWQTIKNDLPPLVPLLVAI